MKITLINPKSISDPFLPKEPKIPYGIAYVAAVLEKGGHQVLIWDRNVEPDSIEQVLKRNKPDIIGLSAMTGVCLLDGIEICQKAKSLWSEIPIVWGGYHSTLLPEQTLAEENIDYIVYGEGEYTMLDLVTAIEHGSAIEDVQGIYYKKGGEPVRTAPRPVIEDLDELPFPAWHLFDMGKYITKSILAGRTINLNTTRGCPFDCSFCCEPAFHKRKWRANGSQRVIQMLKHLKSEYKVERVAFRDSLFTANLKRVAEICDGLIEQKLNLEWYCPARVLDWDRELLKKMRRSGCTDFEFGVENGSPRLLKFINKGIILDQVYDSFQKCNEIGITPNINVIIGLPTETREDFDMTMALLDRLDHGPVGIMIYQPYPGSELMDYVIEHGLFVPPTTLRGWAKIDNPYAIEFPAMGELSKDMLWETARAVRGADERNLWRLAVRKVMQDPKKALRPRFIIASLKYCLRTLKRKILP